MFFFFHFVLQMTQNLLRIKTTVKTFNSNNNNNTINRQLS